MFVWFRSLYFHTFQRVSILCVVKRGACLHCMAMVTRHVFVLDFQVRDRTLVGSGRYAPAPERIYPRLTGRGRISANPDEDPGKQSITGGKNQLSGSPTLVTRLQGIANQSKKVGQVQLFKFQTCDETRTGRNRLTSALPRRSDRLYCAVQGQIMLQTVQIGGVPFNTPTAI